jgi:SAM-dependent methyltransferase
MPVWVWGFFLVAGSLTLLKLSFVACTSAVLPITRGALFVTTPRARIDAFLDAVPLERGASFIDLGCGDGRVLRKARRRYGVEALGFELNPFAYLKARLLSLGRRGVRVTWRNFWTADLSSADVIFCYLFPDVMDDLGRKLERELKPGSLVVSANFPFPGWCPDRTLRPKGSMNYDPMYVYRVPEAYGECETPE